MKIWLTHLSCHFDVEEKEVWVVEVLQFIDYLNGEYECSLSTISQNGGISYSEKE